MKIAASVVAILLLVAGIAVFIEALTTTNSVWVSIPLLALSGVFTRPAIIALLALLGCYDLAIEGNGHRVEFRKLFGSQLGRGRLGKRGSDNPRSAAKRGLCAYRNGFAGHIPCPTHTTVRMREKRGEWLSR
jgi:hypothetical protein